jgi:hypothetical protein
MLFLTKHNKSFQNNNCQQHYVSQLPRKCFAAAPRHFVIGAMLRIAVVIHITRQR